MTEYFKLPRFKNYFLLVVVFLAIAYQPCEAQDKKKNKKGLDLNVEVSLSAMYDDNILKYSHKYLQRFLHNQDEGRFHIQTYDDVAISPSLSLSRSFRFFGKKQTIFDGSFSYNHYQMNDINSWYSSSVGVRQNFGKRASFKLSYSYIPYFYVRHFRDDDWVKVFGFRPETFQAYSFSKDTYAFWIQNTFFKNSRVMFTFNYAIYYHNENYTEYDCNNLLYRVKLFQPLNKSLRIEVTYQFTKSYAKGYDEPHENIHNSDDGDASFDEDGYALGLEWRMPALKKRNQSLKVEGIIYNRFYTTRQYLELDRLHAGRVDNNYRINLNYNLSVNKSMTLGLFYSWLMRDSYSMAKENSQYVSDEKDYTQNQVGISFKYNFKL